MRVFIPIFTSMVQNDFLPVFIAHGATDRLFNVVDASQEEGEAIALLAAADDSLRLLAENPEEPASRLVAAVDVAAVANPDGTLETEVIVNGQVCWSDVVAIFADEPEIIDDIQRARDGDEDAFERVAEADLLWYDVSEVAELVDEINCRPASN